MNDLLIKGLGLAGFLIVCSYINYLFAAFTTTTVFLICDFIESWSLISWLVNRRIEFRKEISRTTNLGYQSTDKLHLLRLYHIGIFTMVFFANIFLFFRYTIYPERVISLICIVMSIDTFQFLSKRYLFGKISPTTVDFMTFPNRLFFAKLLTYFGVLVFIPGLWNLLSVVYPLSKIFETNMVIKIILFGMFGRFVSLIVKRYLGIPRYSRLFGEYGWLDIADSTYMATLLV